MRQQATHQQSANVNNLKSTTRSTASSSSSSSTRHTISNNGSSANSNSNNNNNNNSKSSGTGITSSGVTKSNNTQKHTMANSSSTTSSNTHMTHHSSNSITNNNNSTTTTNGLSGMGHNSSPILPMTPTSSVSPPANVICKKEVNVGAGNGLSSNYHSGGSSVPGLSDVMKATSMHDSIKEEMAMVAHNPSAYSSINARLGQGGNLTPLGSNSSIMTTPSPPITPSQNALSYVPNHETYFWPQYNQSVYANNYNPPASYYSQMEYQSQGNYSMGHSTYSTSNLGLPSGSTFNGSMTSQPFSSNGIEYMTQPDKYVNMVWDMYGELM